MQSKNFRAYAAWVAICFIWGTTYLAIRIVVRDIPPFLFAGSRWILAGPLFLVFLKVRNYKMPGKPDLLPLAIIGLLLLGVANGLVGVAEQWIPSGLTAILISTIPLWVVVIEYILPGAVKINFKVVVGIVLGLCGVVLIFLQDIKFLFLPENIFGIACLLVAVIAWAGGSVYSQRKKLSVHPLVAAAFQMIFAGIAQLIVGLVIGEAGRFNVTQDSLFAFLYLLIIASIGGYGSYIYAIAHLPVSFVTTYAYINPIIALFLGWLVLSEDMNLLIIGSASIILFGVWLVKKGSKI